MRKPLVFVALAVVAGLILAATVFREQVAYAAQAVNATIVGPLDGQGNVKVHEQGTANVSVTNSNLSVTPHPPAATLTRTGGIGTSAGVSTSTIFGTIDASLISLVMHGDGVAFVKDQGTVHFVFDTDDDDVVLPLAETVTVDRLELSCLTTSCFARINAVGH